MVALNQSDFCPTFRVHLAISKDILGCHNWRVLLAYRGQRPGKLLNILQHTEWPYNNESSGPK